MPPIDLLNEPPPANLQPVEFDFAAAARAAAALRTAADLVDRAARMRARDARAAEQGWTGKQRTQFDAEETRLSTAASTLVTQLRRDAAALHTAAERARAANTRRAHALSLWVQHQQALRRQYIAAQAAARR